jgi:NAD(P)-dependent dehydrogenase (short-subunit alcohol dehydrogenase family)
VLIVGPRPDAGPFAGALRAGLENLARTLSIEWSRYGWRIVTILPGRLTSDAALAEVVAFLASPAGDYYSGCALALT